MTAKLWQNQKGNYQVLGPSYMLLISRFLQTYLDVCAGVCLCVRKDVHMTSPVLEQTTKH